ncbi:unannotated protein [freshwater metagenome]|uniref:Unannotated protein n=1 Tax=freshwater metagenome TaxID=449393 RepID=A0A6J6JF19_9ZZZZ
MALSVAILGAGGYVGVKLMYLVVFHQDFTCLIDQRRIGLCLRF